MVDKTTHLIWSKKSSRNDILAMVRLGMQIIQPPPYLKIYGSARYFNAIVLLTVRNKRHGVQKVDALRTAFSQSHCGLSG